MHFEAKENCTQNSETEKKDKEAKNDLQYFHIIEEYTGPIAEKMLNTHVRSEKIRTKYDSAIRYINDSCNFCAWVCIFSSTWPVKIFKIKLSLY